MILIECKCKFCNDMLYVTFSNGIMLDEYICFNCHAEFTKINDKQFRDCKLDTFLNKENYSVIIDYVQKTTIICQETEEMYLIPKHLRIIKTFNHIVNFSPTNIKEKLKAILIFS